MCSEAASILRSAPRARRSARRALFLAWLRRVHLYVGLWGALLGLAFGATGVILNHRAVMKMPIEKVIPSTMQWKLPARPFESPELFAEWLRAELGFGRHEVVQVRRQPAQAVPWGGGTVTQPERWAVMLHSPRRGVNAEYFVGNGYARLERLEATPVGFLTRLHTSVGASAGWVLLADTIAGALILLCVTGLLLWTQLNAIRLAACATSVAATMLAVALV